MYICTYVLDSIRPIHTCVYIYTHLYICIYTYIHMCIYIFTCMYGERQMSTTRKMWTKRHEVCTKRHVYTKRHVQREREMCRESETCLHRVPPALHRDCLHRVPPAPMNHVKIFKGCPPRDATERCLTKSEICVYREACVKRVRDREECETCLHRVDIKQCYSCSSQNYSV